MTSHPNDRADVERRLWNELERRQIGMLGVAGDARSHFQPMTAFAEPDTDEIWFFSRNDTDLVRRIGEGAAAKFIFQSKDLQACIGGELTVRSDPARMDRYWNAVAAAWNPEGREDPHLTMLRLRATDAEVWITEAGPMKFAWEIAKANARHRTPRLGEHAHLDFH